MLFTSIPFLYLFLPVVLLLYFGAFRWSRKAQNYFLLAASLFFYAWGEPKFVLIMLVSIAANYVFGLLIARAKDRGQLRGARGWLWADAVFNLAILYVFKYLVFTAEVVNKLTNGLLPEPQIVLPIGISFFTFQAMSYVIDVYRGNGAVQKNIANLGLYISFFPQLIAGPIVRYETVAAEINSRHETWDDFFSGFRRFQVGFLKKLLLSNTFAIYADRLFNAVTVGNQLSVASSWLGAVCYALQIFFDFSGYSDMAIGLGRMFGFHFLENFDYPYISTSITEFWRRWHMSLGTWFRDYVYIPLGGSRVAKPRLILNLFVVWFLTGVWHGANWTFILWGVMYFVLLTFEKLTGIHQKAKGAGKAAMWVYSMFFVLVGWVLFRAPRLRIAVRYLLNMAAIHSKGIVDGAFWYDLRTVLPYLAVGILMSTPLLNKLYLKLSKYAVADFLMAIGQVALFLIAIAVVMSDSYNPFVYFNF